jgi:hypothetical protein
MSKIMKSLLVISLIIIGGSLGYSVTRHFNTSEWAQWSLNIYYVYLTGDFNGDGKMDALKIDVPSSGSSQNGFWVGISDGTKFGTAEWTRWYTSVNYRYLTGDFNGDGKTDILKIDISPSETSLRGFYVGISDGTKFGTAEWTRWYTNVNYRYLTGDFNGDGKTDILKIDISSSETSLRGFYVGISDGTKFGTAEWARWYTNVNYRYLTGDFNGDGKTDILKIDIPSSGASLNGFWVGISDGTKFIASEWVIWYTSKDVLFMTGDFNGDGKTDIMQIQVPASGTSEQSIYVGLSDGTKFVRTEWAKWYINKNIKYLTGDFNGDGRTDIMQIQTPASGTSNDSVFVGLSSGTKFIRTEWAKWYLNKDFEYLIDDYNGDGKADILKMDVPSSGTAQQGLWVGLSESTNP